VQVSDGNGGTDTQTIAVTVTDINDNAPVVDGPVTGNATEDGAPVALNALAKASDPDSGTTLSIVNLPATLPAGVSFSTGPIPLAQFAGISIPIGSNDGESHPVDDGVWSVSAPPFPINDALGIGYLINPSYNVGLGAAEFSLHDHQYVAPNVPDPS